MDRKQIVSHLHSLVGFRLFGSQEWLPDALFCNALGHTLEKYGLEERLDDQEGVRQITAFGRQLEVDLLVAFMGAHDEWEIAEILERRGLIDTIEAGYLYHLVESESDLENLMKPRVQKAYLKYCHQTGLFD